MLTEEEERSIYNLRPVQQILNLILNDVKELKPMFDLNYRSRYPLVEKVTGLRPPEVLGLLERLALHRILDSSVYDKIIVCEKCSSANIAPKFLCTNCKSPSISKQHMIEHSACGYVGVEAEFLQETKAMIACPGCNAPLRSINAPDIVASEGWFSCNSCSKVSRDLFVIYACRDCDRFMSPRDVKFMNTYTYTLGKSVRRDAIILIEPLRRLAEQLGYTAESPGNLLGKSGINHQFDIVCYDNQTNKIIVIDVVYSNVLVNESHLMKQFMASFDTKPSESIMICAPAVTEVTEKLAKQCNITLIEGVKMEDISEGLKKFLVSLSRSG